MLFRSGKEMIFSCRELSKSFGVTEILKDVSFLIEEKEKVAIIGVNGAGKTTLFKIITGELAADSGEIVIPKDVRLGYLAQMADSLAIQNTIYEEMELVFQDLIDMEEELRMLERSMSILAGEELKKTMDKYSRLSHDFEDRKGYEYKSRIRGVMKGLGFTEEEFQQPIVQLSGGQKTRVSLGKLLLTSPDLLLLDEPTNHLDMESIEWLEGFLKNYQGSILIISHDRYFLDCISSKIIEIENKKATTYGGNYTYFAHKKEEEREIALKHYLNQQKEIKKQEESIKLLKSFNREKSIKRAESKEKQLAKMELVDKPENLPDKMRILLEPKRPSGNDVLLLENVSKKFDDLTLFENVSMDIKRGQKVALLGPNGVGKTTLFRIILDKLEKDSGTIRLGSQVSIAYYDQEQQNLNLDKCILDDIYDAYPKLSLGEIRNVLAAFVFTGDDVFKKISTLSGGERGRVALAKIMLSNANVLILDEPTNHLDLFSKEILEEALRNYTGTILYISHDRYFINHTAEKILVLSKEGIELFDGDYDYYMERKKLLSEEDEKETIHIESHSQNKDDWRRKKEDQAEERKRQSQLQKIEKEIEKQEENIKLLDDLLNSEGICTNPTKIAEIYEKKVALENKLEQLYGQWETLSEPGSDLNHLE